MNGNRQQIIKQHFADVPELVSEGDRFGVFVGDGATNHFSVQSSNAPDGVQFKAHCDNCGTPNVITVDWNELIILGSARMPQGWQYMNGKMYPNVGCGSCNYLCSIQVTPDEAAKYVNGAVQAKIISPQQIAGVRAQLGLR